MINHKSQQWSDAVIDLLKEQKVSLEKSRNDSRVVFEAIRQEPKLIDVLRSPGITTKEKNEIIDEVFTSTNNIYKNTIKLMVEKMLTKNIEDTFNTIYRNISQDLGIKTGVVESAKVLEQQQIKKLEKFYSEKTNSPVELVHIHAPYLVHGLKVTIEGKVYDGSLHGQLKHMKHKLLK